MARRAYVDRLEQVEKLREATKPVVCDNLSDIAAALTRFSDTEQKSVPMVVRLPWSEDNKSRVDTVTGTSRDTTLYQLLIEGMDLVKKRMQVTADIQKAIAAAEAAEDELPIANMEVWDVSAVRFSVDTLIEKRLGGKRHGLRIRWDVVEGTYEYDPYTRKLFEITE